MSISIPIRLAFCSVAVFASTGLHLPYWPVWLADHGISPAGIGMLVAMGYFTRLFAGPAFTFLADRVGDRRAPFIWLAAVHFVGLCAFWFADGFWVIALITIVETGAWSPLIPLKESLTMGWVVARGYDYGRIRLWGSIAFIVMSMIGGFLLTSFGTDGILMGLILLGVVLIISGLMLPADPRKGLQSEDQHSERPKVSMKEVSALLRSSGFILFLIAASAVMASHAVYYAFGTLNWLALGYSNSFIGVLWSLGVVAEILLFAFSAKFISRLSPPVLILIGATAAVVRWTWVSFDPHWSILIMLQCFHALTFGATHLGVMHYIARAVPVEMAATAQGIYAAFGGGVIMGLVMLASGGIYTELGALAYLPMAGLGLIGLAAGGLLWRNWRTAQI